jgi:formylmethanofuran dehydrogenase subunit E-like metal-binding protein
MAHIQCVDSHNAIHDHYCMGVAAGNRLVKNNSYIAVVMILYGFSTEPV